jgi:hypothetical protein
MIARQRTTIALLTLAFGASITGNSVATPLSDRRLQD